MNPQYKIIKASVSSDFSEDVEAHLANGWKLHGSPFVFKAGYITSICQAMTKGVE